ncbi:MAG TPA: flavodoxin [bacterium]|jgi:flavodoxin|nr:NAD(P)H-dependent oxidoreductase [Dictyoglomota bacterium]HOK29224.1 flavodoxin [bacterium]HOL54411.1 flavodoxin [bacterium]HOP55812.1 flavodoxin [bacterium]HPO81592.1 flavodoxin [bacterium]
MPNVLIAYFTWSGNTRRIAELIHSKVDGTLVEIQPEVSYPRSYNVVVNQAKREISMSHKPPLKTKIEHIESYDIIFVGSPNWWGTIAPPVATFLLGYDLRGKTIVPFSTHGGGGQGRISVDIAKLCPGSTILKGFSIYGGELGRAEAMISAWLREIGILM